jgi:ADP-heptose:LPS heptosyltransferase
MAQALGTPSLTIFGPTWGLSWTKPSDPKHQFLQHFLDCGPCDQTLCPLPEKTEPGKHSYQECLVLITPAQVLEKARSMLSHQ